METRRIDRKALAVAIHKNAVDKGFWDEERGLTHYIMLAICELSEAVEAHREGRRADREAYTKRVSSVVTSNAFDIAAFEAYIKDTVGDELADAYIRLLDLSEGNGLDLYSFWRETRETVHACGRLDSFTEKVFLAIAFLYEQSEFEAGSCLDCIETICAEEGIDLLWHIEEKMKYNATRPRLHGKAY